MKTISRLILFIFLALGARAALPPDAVVVEAETMHISGNGWEVRENFDGWFKGWTTGNKCLYGATQGEGEATAKLTCTSNGVYRIWVRYLDLGLKHRSGDNCFIIEALQEKSLAAKDEGDLDLDAILAADAPVGGVMADSLPVERKNTKKFDTFSVRVGPEAEARWGDSWAAFVWDKMEATLSKGEYTLRISKSHPRRAERHQRLIDCIIITSDKTYEPIVEDFSPLYVRFDVPAAATNALRFSLRSRRFDDSDFWDHMSYETPLAQPVKPGKSSDWIEVSKYLKAGKIGQYNRLTFRCYLKQHGDVRDADYTVSFSRTPSGEKILKTVERKGAGSAISFRIDLLNPEGILDEVEESAANLARSRAAPAIGKYPRKFVFSTGCDVGSAMPETVANELQALRNIGINQISFSPAISARYLEHGFTRAEVGFYLWDMAKPVEGVPAACFLNPDTATIEREAEKAEQRARAYPDGVQVMRLANFADEPGFNYLEHVPKCPICRAAFPKYLKAMNVPYEIFAAEADAMAMDMALTGRVDSADAASGLDSVRPCADTNNPHHFYWTSRFGINTATEFTRIGSKTALKNNPAWRATMNFHELRSNLAGTGIDWFEIFRTQALSFGENEDYLAWSKNLQIRGYPMAVMRAACKTHGYAYGPLACYPGNTGWELVCGGFSQIGQGARRLEFFSYGPHYMSVPSPCSGSSWVHDSTKHLTYATGAVEDDLAEAQVMIGDVALLLSSTSDIWNVDPEARLGQGFGNLYGMERNYLYLVLRHLQASVDILAEEDLAADLQKYRMLFVTDSHLRREYAKTIQGWVEAGGALYIGAGALALDEYNKPLGLIEEMGVKRGDLEADGRLCPGRPEFELTQRKSLDKVKTGEHFDAIFATQKLEGGAPVFATTNGRSAMVAAKYGKGMVIAAYTFPAMEYIKTSDWNKALQIHSTVKFQSGPREFIGKVLEIADIIPKARCSNMFLEANLLENGPVVIVSLANWSGEEQEATIVFRGLGKVKDVQAVRSAIKIVSRSDEELIVAGVFGSGDFLKISR